MKKAKFKIDEKIKVHLFAFGREVQTRQSGKVFTVREEHGQLGINWNTENSPYICNGNTFCPFYTFHSSVAFEKVKTGKLYYFDPVRKTFERWQTQEVPAN